MNVPMEEDNQQRLRAAPVMRRVYWESTAGCNLRCIHCRRIDVLDRVSPDELTTEQSKAFIDDLSGMGKPVFILTGGEPLFRKDIFEIASYAKGKGLPVALSTNGTLVTEAIAARIKEAGIYYASISLDGARPETHDIFRGEGNYDRALRGMINLKKAGIKVQVNFTVTNQNVHEIPEIYDLVRRHEAHALYLFLLVPVGCGLQIADSQMLSTSEVENWLKWVCQVEQERPTPEVRAICAPQFYRIKAQYLKEKGDEQKAEAYMQKRMGCLAAINVCFVSHMGDVFPCGYLPIAAGNIKSVPLSKIWHDSSLFHKLRDEDSLEGKCGACEYKTACGGCRARALYRFGSELAEEPYCEYEPGKKDGLVSTRAYS